jgi:predicted amidohydrolase
MKDFKIACVQIASGPKIKANLLEVSKYISEAKNKGANIVLLPENFAVMVKDDIMYLDYQEKFGDGIIQNFISDEAKKK